MKTILALFFALSAVCMAQTPAAPVVITAPVVAVDELKNAKAVAIYEITHNPGAYNGRIVKITFGWRDGEMLAVNRGKLKSKIRVIVPDGGRQWFDSVTTKEFSSQQLSAYARIGDRRVELLGRELRGDKLVW